ncbi:MAG: hypothetical protein OEM02_12750 [Desulfobulbaceae bacterium]|nr:hypothetical protein [Desulfobulbaceae bacterium]
METTQNLLLVAQNAILVFLFFTATLKTNFLKNLIFTQYDLLIFILGLLLSPLVKPAHHLIDFLAIAFPIRLICTVAKGCLAFLEWSSPDSHFLSQVSGMIQESVFYS